MASYEYAVWTQEQTRPGHFEGREQLHTVGGKVVAWTADTAVAAVRGVLVRCNEGSKARIERRRGPRSAWTIHRAYVVNARGIVERTDR